jgi:ADP-ribose pyrophosphatase YjhB (NUDIX family)
VNDLREQLYLIADEMRGMATLGRTFAANVYEAERAHRIMELAAAVAALAEGETREEVRLIFDAEPWHRATPAAGVDALVLDGAGRILLVQRKDNGRWAMPGGIAEIGHSPAESALKELWEEAGLRGRATRLLGVFDSRLWGSRSKVHMVHFVFHVDCEALEPAHGIEMLDARFFPTDALPTEMHYGHDRRIARCLELLREGGTHFDPADTREGAMPMFQRGAQCSVPGAE